MFDDVGHLFGGGCCFDKFYGCILLQLFFGQGGQNSQVLLNIECSV